MQNYVMPEIFAFPESEAGNKEMIGGDCVFRYPETLDVNTLVSCWLGDRGLQIQYRPKEGIRPSPAFLENENTVVFQNVAEETDLIYVIGRNSVKQIIRLGKNAPRNFPLWILSSNALKHLVSDDYTALDFYKKFGDDDYERRVMQLKVGVRAMDAAGRSSTAAINYRCRLIGENAIELCAEILPRWRDAKARVFPLSVTCELKFE